MDKKKIVNAMECIEMYCQANEKDVKVYSVEELVSLIKELTKQLKPEYIQKEPEYIHDTVMYIEAASILIQHFTE